MDVLFGHEIAWMRRRGVLLETPDFQDGMTCQPTQDPFFPLFLRSESGMRSKNLEATPRVGRQSNTHTANTQ